MADERASTCRKCGGLFVVVRTLENGRRVFNCERCGDNECMECAVCHKPRGIWANAGIICGMCALAAMDGKVVLSPEQIASINAWRIVIPIKDIQ